MSISRLRKLIKAFVFYPEFRLILQAMKKNVISANGNVMSKKVEKWTGRYCNLLVESILEEEDYFKREDTCNGKSINLLYVGFLRPAKGLEYLLAAMKELVARHDWNINFRVVGNGEYREFLEKETGRLGLDNHVEFTGHLGIRKDLNQAYRESDIFVFPSLSESGPRVVLEAMANSLPVVSTAVGDTPFFLKDGRGIVIPPKSKSSIVDAVSLYLDNCEFRRRAIKRSFDFTRRYNLVDYVESFLELIRNSRHGA